MKRIFQIEPTVLAQHFLLLYNTVNLFLLSMPIKQIIVFDNVCREHTALPSQISRRE